MQFQVPQNVDLEDKVIGPLTLKQFMALLVGGMADYILYLLCGKRIVIFIILALPITLFAVAWAFVKVQDQAFPKFFGAFLMFLAKPKIRTWGQNAPKPRIVEAPPKKSVLEKPAKTMVARSELQELAKTIDTRGWSETKPSNQPTNQPSPKSESDKKPKTAKPAISQREKFPIPPYQKPKDETPPLPPPPEQIEEELNLEERVKSSVHAKPKLNLPTEQGQGPEDIMQ